MIEVQVAVAAGPDELAGLEVALLREHVRQQRVAGDVEGHAEEDIGAALVELTGQPAVGDVELEQRMAGLRLHPLELAHVPGADDDAARIRVAAQLLERHADLIDGAPVGRQPGAPLLAVDRAQLAALIGPLVPDGDAVLAQPRDVGVAAQEPEQLVDDRAQVDRLGGDQRESLRQVEAQLLAEQRQRAGAGAVPLARAAAPGCGASVRGRLSSRAAHCAVAKLPEGARAL